jgi:subtilisin family serine protease
MGTVESPADLPTVIGVGSLTTFLDDLAFFSSRGMNKHNLLKGIGYAKPDILLPGENVLGISLNPNKCESKQGTSFSVPILTGSIALALSALDIKIGYSQRKMI